MFGTKPKQKQSLPGMASPTSATASGGLTTIDQHTVITGDIEASGDIRIDGRLVGNLTCKARLIIGPSGSLVGDVTSDSALVEGKFRGTMQVAQALIVKETAQVSGNLRAGVTTICSGSEIEITCALNEAEAPAPQRKEARVAKQEVTKNVAA